MRLFPKQVGTQELRCKVSFAWWPNTLLLPLLQTNPLYFNNNKAQENQPHVGGPFKVCRAFKVQLVGFFPQYPHDGLLFWSGVPSTIIHGTFGELGSRVLFSSLKWVKNCDFNNCICTYVHILYVLFCPLMTTHQLPCQVPFGACVH